MAMTAVMLKISWIENSRIRDIFLKKKTKQDSCVEPLNEGFAPVDQMKALPQCVQGAQLHAKSNLQIREVEGGVRDGAQRIQI